MKIAQSFEITDVAGEYMAIPIGEAAASFNGIIALNEAAAYLLGQMHSPKSKEELVDILTTEYQVERVVAQNDVDSFISKMLKLGLILE